MTNSSIEGESSNSGGRYPHHTTACFAFSTCSGDVSVHEVKLLQRVFTPLFERFIFQSVRSEILGHSMGTETSICPYRTDSNCQSSVLKLTCSDKLSQSLLRANVNSGRNTWVEKHMHFHNFPNNWIVILLNAQLQFRLDASLNCRQQTRRSLNVWKSAHREYFPWCKYCRSVKCLLTSTPTSILKIHVTLLSYFSLMESC
jgi:hypothetical protein